MSNQFLTAKPEAAELHNLSKPCIAAPSALAKRGHGTHLEEVETCGSDVGTHIYCNTLLEFSLSLLHQTLMHEGVSKITVFQN